MVSAKPKEWDTLAGRIEWMFEYLYGIGISGREIGRRAGISPGGISVQRKRISEGHTIELKTVIGLRKAFDVPWDWLMEGTGWPSEEIQRKLNPGLKSVK